MIKQLRSGNAQSVRTIQIENLITDIINETFSIDEQARGFINSGNIQNFQNLADTLALLEKDKLLIEKLALSINDSNKLMISRFTSLLERKTAPAKALKFNSTPEEKNSILYALSSENSGVVTDSIYITALGIQLTFEKGLETTIIRNERLSQRALSFGKILALISVLAISFLVTIIVIRLLKHYQLIKALQKARQQTEEAAKVKEQFLSNMSHEIRTPVNSVIGFTSLLQKTGLNSDQKQFVGLIKSASDNLLNIVNDILDISKIEAGMLHFDKNPFSLSELCYSLEMMFFHRAADKKLSLEWFVDENVPDILIGDKERLTQIMNNLISNALKFTDKGGVTVRIASQEIKEKNVALRIAVKDTGIGIPQDKLETIFERFEQVKTGDTKNFGGTGLGLNIVKKMVELQGGSISARSEPGAGAEFIIFIPYEIGQEDGISKIKFGSFKNICPVNEIQSLADSKILAAEDNKMNQMLLTYVLRQWGLDFDLAENGQRAIDMLRQNKYDLVLMDIQMPVMDGYTATGVIRNELKLDIPIIAMTAKVLPGEKEKCRGLGMSNYISKPLNEDILYDMLMEYISIKEPQPGNRENIRFTDKAYLNKIYKDNTEFISKLVNQFLEQFPKEMDELHQSITDREYTAVVKYSHNMKTTVLSLNKDSPLLEHLEAMENAENNASGWEIIQYRLKMLLEKKETVLNEVNQYLKELAGK